MNHVWRSAVLCLSTYASVFASAQAQPVGGFIVQPRAEDVWDNPAPFSPEFLSDPTRRAMVSKALRLALKPERLGQVWPSGKDPEGVCEDFRAWSSDGHFPIEDSWVFRCRSEQASGVREFYYHDFDLDRPPVLHRIRNVVAAPSGSNPRTWKDLQRSLVVEFAAEGKGTVHWSGADSGLVSVRTSAYDISIGLGPNWKTRILELEINAYSRRILDLVRERDRDTSDVVWRPPSLPPSRRNAILNALREQVPALAASLSLGKPRMADTSVVFAELRRASSRLDGEGRDSRLYAAHCWVAWIALQLGDDSVAAARAIDAAIKPFGGSLEPSHWGGWTYNDGLRAKLSARPGENRWTDEAFLEETDVCYSLRQTNIDVWKEVLRASEAYLSKFPSSPIAPDIVLHMAEAHETAWSLSKSEAIPDYLDPARYRLDAQRHRTEALELYERYLRVRPASPEADSIRRRMYRLRLDVDTGFHKYYCPEVC